MNFQKVQALLRSKQIAPFIDIAMPDSASGIVRCPFCGQISFHIQQHPSGEGEWQHCSKCNRQGTPLTIAAELLHRSVAEAASYLLESQGVVSSPEVIARIVHQEETELDILRFWLDSHQNVHCPSPLQIDVLCRLNWASAQRLFGRVAFRGPGLHIGLCSAEVAASKLDLRLKKRENAGVVVPYFSPLRQLVGLQVITNQEQVFSRRNNQAMGFAYYSKEVFESSHVVYLSSLLRLVGMLYTQAALQGLESLPLAAWRDEGLPLHACHTASLVGHSVVLLEPTLTPSVVQLAMECDAKLYFVPHRADDQLNLLRPTSPDLRNWAQSGRVSGVLADCHKSALSLGAAVRVWKSKATQADIGLLLQAAGPYPEEVQHTIHRLLSASSHKIYYNPKTQRPPVIIDTGTSTISLIEKNNAVHTADGKKVFPGIIRLGGIVDREGDAEYIGNISTGEQLIPFRVRKSDLTYSWFYAYLENKSVIARSTKHVSLCDRVSADHLLSLAIHQNPPKLYTGVSRIGWDGKGFQYARMRIESGNVSLTPSFLVEETSGGPDFTNVRPPQDFHYVYHQKTELAAQAWAWVTVLSAIITAPVYGLPPLGIVLENVKFNVELSHVLRQFCIRIRTNKFHDPCWFYYKGATNKKQRQHQIGPWLLYLQDNLSKQADDRTSAYRLRADKLVDNAAKLQHMLMPVMYYLRYFTKNRPTKVPQNWHDWNAFTTRNIGKCFSVVDNSSVSRRSKHYRLRLKER